MRIPNQTREGFTRARCCNDVPRHRDPTHSAEVIEGGDKDDAQDEPRLRVPVGSGWERCKAEKQQSQGLCQSSVTRQRRPSFVAPPTRPSRGCWAAVTQSPSSHVRPACWWRKQGRMRAQVCPEGSPIRPQPAANRSPAYQAWTRPGRFPI